MTPAVQIQPVPVPAVTGSSRPVTPAADAHGRPGAAAMCGSSKPGTAEVLVKEQSWADEEDLEGIHEMRASQQVGAEVQKIWY